VDLNGTSGVLEFDADVGLGDWRWLIKFDGQEAWGGASWYQCCCRLCWLELAALR
jgi:hypothetical protein